ncbi:hypothetical protein H0H81_003937 [Sphagnurus paluster]|uniref:Uncharacterized protein n=1 Tax=Sphagnurus paluster TaxID=117069 RepID=A0A9P7KJK2_9AGAR|nr:hypothetical protein H0H81_003937 [Sphagnurus paluster]
MLFVSNAIVDAGPTPSQKPISKYKPIPKGGKEHLVTEVPTGVAAMKKVTLESFALFPLALLPLAVFPLTWTHPNPAGKIRLYHGAEKDIPGGHVNLALSSQAGDFSNRPSFYLTDRPRAALQFACLADSVFYGDPEQIVAAEMWIIEYEWDGGGANIHTFSGTNDPAWKGVRFISRFLYGSAYGQE